MFAIFTSLHFFVAFCGAFNTAAMNKSSRQLHSTLLSKRLPSGSIIGRPVNPMLIFSTPTNDMGDPRHSYVEGSTFDNRFDEIEAMGGDPSFLDDDDENEVKMAKLDLGEFNKKANKQSVTDGKGPTQMQDKNMAEKTDPDWEWDGIVDEDAQWD